MGRTADEESTNDHEHTTNWGGVREGAGRPPNSEPALWMQLGVMLSDTEKEILEKLDLSPAERRIRLLENSQSNIALPSTNTDPTAKRKQYNLRVVLKDWSERLALLGLDAAERRRRLLTSVYGAENDQDENQLLEIIEP